MSSSQTCPGKKPVALTLMTMFFLVTSLAAEQRRVPQDYTTIQAGINAASQGETVLVSAGTYRERIQLKEGVIVRSEGDDTRGMRGLNRAEMTIIDGSMDGAKGPGVAMAENSVLDGFTVTGIGSYDDAKWNKHHATQGEEQAHEHIGAPGTAGIAVNGIHHCSVTNNIVHHIGYTGIAITGAKEKRVSPLITRNITYRNMGGGIGSMQGSTATIEENICFENFYAGIGHNNASPLVVNNTCYANIRAGIGISEHSRPIVRNNKCYKNRRAGIGIRTGEETSPLVEHNECYENDMAGIGAREDSSPIIRHNRCYRNAMAGIGAQSNARPVIVDNECFENKMAGIGTEEGAAAIIRGNTCYKNLMTGIGARDGARPIIDNNKCFENKLVGISAEKGAHAIIHGNECLKNGQAGIGLREKAEGIILNNKCLENKLVAIGVRTGSIAHIGHNLLVRTGGMPPIIAIREGSSAVVNDNTIKGGGVAGVMVQGTAYIINNQFQGNGPRSGPGPPNHAAWIHGGSTVSFRNNQVDHWRHALFASGAHRVWATDNTVKNFLGTAIVIEKSTLPVHVFGNTAFSDSEKDTAARVDGPQGIVAENVRKPSISPKEAARE